MTTKANLLVALAAASALAGCAKNHASLDFFGVCSAPANAATCTFPAGKCDLYALGRPFVTTGLVVRTIGGGTATVSNELVLVMEVRNGMNNNADAESGRPNTHDAIIEKFQLSFFSPGINVADTAYPTAGVPVPAAGSATEAVVLIPSNEMALIQAAMAAAGETTRVVVVEVRAAGRTNDDQHFVSGGFRVPVDVVLATFDTTTFCPAGDDFFACPNAGQPGSTACVTP